MNQQTAVEWLAEQIKNDQNQKALTQTEWIQVIEQAKQMEKEQMLSLIRFMRINDKMGKSVECLKKQYYNETYNK